MKKRKAIYPGSFDPLTNGHLDLIKRALTLFDEVWVLVASNTAKKTLFTAKERVSFIKESFRGVPNVKVEITEGLTVDFASKHGAYAIIRGLRATSDFDYEFQMALTNRKLAKDIDTVFLMPSESNFYLSSKLIKEIALLKGNVSGYVPKIVARKLKEKFKTKALKL